MEVIESLRSSVRRYFNDADMARIPIAEGSEGTVEAVVTAAWVC